MASARSKTAAVAVLFALTACGGGGGGTPPSATSPGSGGQLPAPAPGPTPAPAPGPAPAPSPTPAVAPPVQLSETAAAAGESFQAAPLATGGYVVVWSVPNTSGSGGNAVYVQIFDASGAKVGSPVQVFAAMSSSHGVAALPDGSFLVSANDSFYDSAAGMLTVRVYVQKVSASGQLLATGGVPDPAVNAGLADLVQNVNYSDAVSLYDGPIFVNGDGSYTIGVRQDSHGTPTQFFRQSLVSVDASGQVIGSPVQLGGASWWRPAIARLPNGNFLFASTDIVPGPGVFVLAPVAWKIVTPSGQVVAQQTMGANTSSPEVALLSDGTALVAWVDPAAQGLVVQRIDAAGGVLGTVTMPGSFGWVTALPHGGYVFTWTSGSQVLAQYFTAAGAASGNSFAVADNIDTSTQAAVYAAHATASGFVVVYQTAGKQVYEVPFTSPSLE
jgi:hypothetical protein